MQRFRSNFTGLLFRWTVQQTRGAKRTPGYIRARDLKRRVVKNREVEISTVEPSESTSKVDSGILKLTPEDERLINRGDFFGIRSTSQETNEELAPEVVIGKLKEMLDNNLRFNAEFYLVNILFPIENNNPTFLNMIKMAPESYIPLFIRCCGLVMSDVPEENRLFLLDRLLKALKQSDLKLTLVGYNALLETWLENGYNFDVEEVLKNAELDRGLTLDIRFFNNLLWGLAMAGKHGKMKDMLLEMSKRGILSDFESELPQIYAAALCGFEQKCTSLITRAIQKYGEDKKQACVSAEIKGVAAARNLNRLRHLLRNNVTTRVIEDSPDFTNKKTQKSRYIINLPYDTVFEVIWQLAKKSTYGDGQEFAALTEQILEHAQRTTGYFKRLFRETERHVAHEFYYSAAVLITETGRVKDMLQNQRKSLFRNHIFPRICHQLIRKRVEPDIIWDISNRLIASFGPESAVTSENESFLSIDEFSNDKSNESTEVSPVKNHHLLKILKRYFLECENIQLVIEFVYELKRMFPYSVAEHETRFDSVKAYESFFQTILGSSSGGLTPEKVNEAIDLVTLLIKLDIMMLHGNETLTLSFVEKVLYFLGWDTAVDTWLKFQSSLYCSNGLFALMKYADKTKIQFLLHRAKNFISGSRANAFLAGAYVSKGQIDEAENIFQSKDYPLQRSDYLNIFRLLQLQRRNEIALEYSKLCLKYTDLRTNQHGCHLFISYWLWLCEFRRRGVAALDFYELFRSYDVPLTLLQMERLDKICNNQKEVISKWIMDEKTKVLNGSKSDTADDFLSRYADFQKDLDLVRSGKELRSTKWKNETRI